MDIFSLSTEQEAAIDITKNISVSAGAGSGKTRVLTNRFLALLESDIEIEEIVAITFTEKAALEMKERIRKAILEKIAVCSIEEKSKWQLNLDKLTRANISTIHSFCSKIIKENAAILGLDFNFSIINEIDKILILNEETKKAIERHQEEYFELIDKLKEVYGEDYVSGAMVKELQRLREGILEQGKKIEAVYESKKNKVAMEFLLKIVMEIDEEYSKHKFSQDLLDYSDLESLALKVLQEKRIIERYKKRFKRFLVDEFQDTNEIQKQIIYNFVTDDRGALVPQKLFIVGDFKQSIYGFRGTDYTIFKKVSEDIGIDGQVALSTCYRSKNEIIQGVNEIFQYLIEGYERLNTVEEPTGEKRISVITYRNDSEYNKSEVSKVKELIKDKSIGCEEFKKALEELKESYNKVTLKANKKGLAVMKGIKKLRNRGLDFKDICILVRSKYSIPDIEEQLKKRRIPYCIIGGRGFYNKTEIEEILNLYQVAITGLEGEFSITQEKNLIRALRGSFFEISDDLLFKIKIEKDENPSCSNFYEAIDFAIDGMAKESNNEFGVEDKEKLVKAQQTLYCLNKIKGKVSVVQILKAIVEQCEARELMLSQQGGMQRFRNVEKLLHEAEKYDAIELFAPEQFLEYIELLNEFSMEDSEASLDTEDSEAIKIMTIHQSKGLEFEGVIIPDIDADQLKISKKEANKPNVVYHNGSVLFRKHIEGDSFGEETQQYKEYDNGKLLKEVKEAIRILYVAMTRAKQYVILVGGEDKEEPSEISEESEKIDKLNSFSKQINYAVKVKAANNAYIEFIEEESLEDLEPAEELMEAEEEIDNESVTLRLAYQASVKPRNTISASTYMNYSKCPRRYYIEKVLKVKGSDYIEREIAKSEEVVVDAIDLRRVDASTTGTMVHRIIELMQEEQFNLDRSISLKDVLEEKEEKLINEVIEKALIENGFLKDEGSITEEIKNNYSYLTNKVRKCIRNFKSIEIKNNNQGNLVLTNNEAYYLLSPLEDRKTIITGFIDRLQVFENQGKYIAVITDYKTNIIRDENYIKDLRNLYSYQLNLYANAIKELLYVKGRKVDEVILQLYFLDTGEVETIDYDEATISIQLKDMDSVFGRNLGESRVEEFERAEEKECEKCLYRGVCGKIS